MKKIRVLVVDDSAVVRQTMTEILNSDPDIEVMATAADPYFAAEKIRQELPDVITLDVEMPRMDGITFLQKIMTQHPIPIVMCSSLTEKGCQTTFKAIEFGAVEIITKPKMGVRQFIEESKIRICDAVKAASKVGQSGLKRKRSILQAEKKLTADVILQKAKTYAMDQTTQKVVVVGASTGGTEAISQFLQELPIDCPGIVITQHMPERFTANFAERLNEICKVTVKEAQNNDTVSTGKALIAPGDFHTLLKRSGSRYFVEVRKGPLVCRHRPSVDVLFRSAARYAGKNAVGAIMTGMGDDGAQGMLEMKEAGAQTIAQDEASCVVFGMPKEAIERGAVDYILPLNNISSKVIQLTQD